MFVLFQLETSFEAKWYRIFVRMEWQTSRGLLNAICVITLYMPLSRQAKLIYLEESGNLQTVVILPTKWQHSE